MLDRQTRTRWKPEFRQAEKCEEVEGEWREEKCGNGGSRQEKCSGRNTWGLVQLLLWHAKAWTAGKGKGGWKGIMMCLLILSFPEITAKSCVVLCCFHTGTMHVYVILPGSGWFRARLLILSPSPHKPFMSPSPFNGRLLYVLPEVSLCLLPFCWHLYQILLICMWCSDWHAPHLASVKDSSNVPVLQSIEREVLRSLEKFLCRVWGRREPAAGSWRSR